MAITSYYVEASQLSDIASAIRAKMELTGQSPAVPLAFPSGFTGWLQQSCFDYQSLAWVRPGGDLVLRDYIQNIRKYGYANSPMRTVQGQSVTNIETGAFTECYSLTQVSFPITHNLGQSAFRYCSSLISADFPSVSGVIGNYAFANCTNLSTISFPNATGIGQYAFATTGLSGTITSAMFHCSDVRSYAFQNCKSLTSVNLSATGAKWSGVGTGIFDGCNKLATIRLCGVSFISAYAFRSCFMLKSLYLYGLSKVPSLASTTAFTSTPLFNYSTSAGAWGKIYVPSSLYASFQTATNWSNASIKARLASANI